MPREIKDHGQIVKAFQSVEIVSELVEKLPNGEFRNELDMDIILFGRSYRGKKVGPYVRLLEYQSGDVIVREHSWESDIFYLLVRGQLEATITAAGGERKILGEVKQGNSFGEMALLAGTMRSANISVTGTEPAFVLELTRPALRLLRKLPKFATALDRNYRTYGATLTLNELKEFSSNTLDPSVLKKLDDAGRFAIYETDQVLFREGDPVNRVVLIRNGWIQRVSGADYNPKAAGALVQTQASVGLDFLGAGSCLGLDAVEAPRVWQYTATVCGRAEVYEIAVSRLREDAEMRAKVVPVLNAASQVDDAPKPEKARDKRTLGALNKEIETGIVDGLNLLVMDMAKCIRCGNCSLACHKVHGHSRLVRQGIHVERPVVPGKQKIQSVLVPSVCMHCQDPECLTGCPTGAITRFPGGEIDIHPETCIGCGDCATQCPYNAISMIPRDPKANVNGGRGVLARMLSVFSLRPSRLPEPVTQTENLLAVKCNLCKNTGMNPSGAKREAYSCEENCPTGALVRVNPHDYFDEVGNTIGLIKKSKTHAIGVNIHKRDALAAAFHFMGSLTIIVASVLLGWAVYRFSLDIPLGSSGWLTVRWITGFLGLAGISWVMAYPIRKQVYRRRAGALRYWMLSHVYLGVFAGVVLLLHGGTSSGGLLTTLLVISFDLVIGSGIFGALCYLIVPRFMTRIEGEPLLLEDLLDRRAELRAKLVRASSETDNNDLKRIIRKQVRRSFLGTRYLMRQFVNREDFIVMLANARAKFRAVAEGLPRGDEARLMDAVESAATLRRIDALCYLHQLLKLWIAPHVLFTSVMLVLMLIHIAQVVYFSSR
jgi:Fe-S-cluster-containing dehydrogenase component/CRP-like cAMP-binding protein